ncbi:MAG: hypothetical protein B1H08_00130 [Candidatus Omnitrophica bacterium 4484_171]|nr:MAG: hypothetical protein B1H08_00130 [Candidatus Omnitrophica bacterium 4484_171]
MKHLFLKRTVLLVLSAAIFIFPSLNVLSKDQKLKVILFYSSHCGHCIKLEKEFMPRIINRYKDKVDLETLNVEDSKNLNVLVSLSRQYGKNRAGVPSVFVGNDFIVGTREIENNLERLIDKYLRKRPVLPYLFSGVNLVEQFKAISVLTIVSAGLIDGINPCAFAVIVFFISFLSVYGYNKREIVYIGLSYVLSVFITYILIGLGLFEFFYSMSHFYFIMKLFYYSIAVFCFVLSGFALYDFIRYRKTKENDGLILQLPLFLKKRINFVIGAGLRRKSYTRIIELCGISLLVGFCVSLLEAACTGQVYVPTIAFILKLPQLRIRAAAYLILYNLMFILPLIIIFALSLLGVSSKKFNLFLKNNLARIKVLMVFFFLGMGMFILWLS